MHHRVVATISAAMFSSVGDSAVASRLRSVGHGLLGQYVDADAGGTSEGLKIAPGANARRSMQLRDVCGGRGHRACVVVVSPTLAAQ